MNLKLNLNKNQVAFILDAIDLFDSDGDYESENHRFNLSEEEIADLYSIMENFLK